MRFAWSVVVRLYYNGSDRGFALGCACQVSSAKPMLYVLYGYFRTFFFFRRLRTDWRSAPSSASACSQSFSFLRPLDEDLNTLYLTASFFIRLRRLPLSSCPRRGFQLLSGGCTFGCASPLFSAFSFSDSLLLPAPLPRLPRLTFSRLKILGAAVHSWLRTSSHFAFVRNLSEIHGF